MATDAYHRSGYQVEDIGLEDDFTINDINDEDYAADAEDNGEIQQNKQPLIDPGLFRYNRKVCVAAIPCFFLLLAITGEMLLVIASFGLALILSIDHGGHNQRTIVIFISLFVPSHVLILYSVVPLLWVSLLSIILMGLVNVFVLLTGAWIAIQFSLFRKQETEMCAVTEKLLFSVYPGVSACLLTWAIATVIPLRLVPFILMGIGFVFLQVFMAPASPSFRQASKKSDESDHCIVDHLMLAGIAAIYCLLPSLIQIIIGIYQLGLPGIFQVWFVIDVLFLLALCVFSTTLMSIRSVIESMGWDYNSVIKVRWISGAMATVLCYPALLNLGITSHFLPWLPAAIALYSIYGVLLSYKKYKVVSSVCLLCVVLFSLVWPLKLPWKLTYNFMFGLPLTWIYVMMLVNSLLCLISIFTATHGRQEAFSIMVVLQTLVFVKCEWILFAARLYGWPILVITTTVAAYVIQRLQIARKLPQGLATFCISAHITKTMAALLYVFLKYQQMTMINYLLLFFSIFMITKVFINETRPDITPKQILIDLVLLCLSVMSTTSPIFFIFASYLFQVQATAADASGLCCIVCGVLIIAVCSLHLSPEVNVKQVGIMGICVGILILVLQPTVERTLYSLFQWSEFVSQILTVLLLSTDFIQTFPLIVMCSVFLGVIPGIRCVILLYGSEFPVISTILFIATFICIFCAVVCFFKARFLGHSFEKYMMKLCILLVLLSQATLISDLLVKNKSDRVLSVPAWKLFLGANLIVSTTLKILSFQKYAEIIPLTQQKEEKGLPLLALAGNIATIMSFLLTCLLAPASGFLHDIWCCAACLILICLQKDMKIFSALREENQTVPTKIAAIGVLVLGTVYRNMFWDASGFTFFRCILELLLLCGTIPVYYILWGILWQGEILLNEQFAVFLMPLNVPLILYGSSYTAWALAVTGIVASVWLMVNKLPLKNMLERERGR